jgi:hypothetical protein
MESKTLKTEKFPKTFLLDELDLPGEAIEDRVIDTRRWSVDHEIIWKHPDGRFFRCWYSVGATECQDEFPWQSDDSVECTQVEKKQVTREEWVPVQ